MCSLALVLVPRRFCIALRQAGLLRALGGFRVLGRGLGCQGWGLGCRIWCLGLQFRVQGVGSGFMRAIFFYTDGSFQKPRNLEQDPF